MASEQAVAAISLLKIEEEAAFATENGAHSWEDVDAIEPTLTRSQLTHRKKVRCQRLTQHPGRVHGRKEGQLTFGCYLVGAGTALSTSATPSDDTLQKCLKASMGNSCSAAGSTAAAGSTTTTVNVQAGHGSRFKPGTAIMLEGTATDGGNEISVVESIATDAVSLEIATSTSISVGKNVWNGYTAYVDPSQSGTLQAQAIGDADAAEWLALGLHGGFTMENLLQLEEVASVNFQYDIVKWEQDVAALAAASTDEPAPLGTSEDLEIQFQTHGTTTRNLISLSALSVDPRLQWSLLRARGNGDTEHADRVRMTGGPATDSGPTCSFTADVDSDFLSAFDADAEKLIAIMFGRTPGRSWCVCLPRCIVSDVPPEGVHAEQLASEVSLEAKENNAGDASEYYHRSPMFITRL